LLAYGERVFALQEYGAFFIDGGGASRDFVVKRVPRLGGRAVRGGACVIGDEIFYLCEDGLYKRTENHDGELLSNRIDGVDFSAPIKATCVENRYRLEYQDEQGDRKARVFDGESGNAYESFPLQATCGKNTTFGVSEGKIVELAYGGELPKGEKRIALSYPTDFGENAEKTLRRICVTGQGNLQVTVRSERGFRRFAFELVKGGEASFSLKGKRFEVELALDANTVVESLEAEYETLGVNGRDD
jgi:hypothetical protein